MTPKPNWLYRQSAVIPYRLREGRLEIVLVTSNSSKHWIFPKGIIEPDMTPEASAAKEALEEAGVIGSPSSELISVYEYKKWGGICNVQVFPLEVTEVLSDWDESDLRERIIVNISHALLVIKKNQRPSLERFMERFPSDSSSTFQ